MNVDYIKFDKRADRSHYIVQKFSQFLAGKVLDVGCDKAVLRDILKNVGYTGIDIAGAPDIQLDMDKIDRLPFADNEFDAVICADVLEHLDNLHLMFGEMVRVAQKYLIISLPNNWANARRPIKNGAGAIAHYGLPAMRPGDRHKWFFSLSEALQFLQAQENIYQISIIESVVNEKQRPLIIRTLRRLKYPVAENYLNRYAHTVWAVFRKA